MIFLDIPYEFEFVYTFGLFVYRAKLSVQCNATLNYLLSVNLFVSRTFSPKIKLNIANNELLNSINLRA